MSKEKIDAKGNERVRCEVCDEYFHSLAVHIASKHGLNVEKYKGMFPGAPTMSVYGKSRLSEGKSANGKTKETPAPLQETDSADPAVSLAETLSELEYLYFGTSKLVVRKSLSELDAANVPEHDVNYKFWDLDSLEAVATAIELDTNILLVGPTGCGKTSMVVELGALLNHPVKRVNMDGDVRSSDFLGQMMLTVDTETGQAVTNWVDGVLPQAMRNGWWLILDELDGAPAHILMNLQSVLEKGHKLTLKENFGETVTARPSFRIIATANTLGHGDDSGLYVGTNVLNEATLDRFGLVLSCSYPPATQESEIVVSKSGLAKSMSGLFCEVANKIRAGNSNDECTCTFSTRRLINWAVFTVKFGNPKKAAKYAVLQRLNKEDKTYVLGVMQRVIGGTATDWA